MRAVQSQAQGGQSALAELCRLYWYPLYVFARLSGHSPDDAQDLIQGFFLDLLEHRAPMGVDRLKGKFRSFLLASLQNYLSDELDRTRCLKRGRDGEFIHLDSEDAEERYRFEPVEFIYVDDQSSDATPQLLAKIAAEVGDGVVNSLRITGPVAPSWRKGRLHIAGRGPRDTYG